MKNLSRSLVVLAFCATAAVAQEPSREAPARKPVQVKQEEHAPRGEKMRAHPEHPLEGRHDNRHHHGIDSREQHCCHAWGLFKKEHPHVAARLELGADKDHDGKLDPKELRAAREKFREYERQRWLQWKKEHPELAAKLKERADRDDDGKLDPFERVQAMRRAEKLRDEHDERRDKDRDDGKEGSYPRPDAEALQKRKERREEWRDERREEWREKHEGQAHPDADGKLVPKERRQEQPERADKRQEPRSRPAPGK